jgi:hypothetical protein
MTLCLFAEPLVKKHASEYRARRINGSDASPRGCSDNELLREEKQTMNTIAKVISAISGSPILRGLCFLMAFFLTSRLRANALGRRRKIAHAILLTTIVVTLYSEWAHYRVTRQGWDMNHGFPYPDPITNFLLRYFDRMYPVKAGAFKLHGEYPLVAFLCGLTSAIMGVVSGLLLGLIVKTGGKGENKNSKWE